ncbi:MAG TPA: heme lyase NrfEFG subunit NrfE, partial [Rhizobiales bacterium]|nr:heme lyase NrfEFG subunit NrfE [Hyphomicrobiales bacterium]
FAGLPRSTWGTALAHLGLGVTVLGIVGVMSFQGERIVAMRQGDTAELAGYSLRFEGMRTVKGPNFTEDQGVFSLRTVAGKDLGEIVSAKRIYPARQMPTTEAGIRTFGASQLYVSLGDLTGDGGIVVRIWWKPMVTLIWIGALVMMGGGIVSLLDRRLRVGAPAARRRRELAAGAAS